MKKKNKGFSIPELLAVIVIMGILVTIATASYNGISKSMKERTYNNKVNLIKTKALEYAADNGVDVATISVAKLISEGYLEVENRKGVMEQFPLTSLSIGVVEADKGRFKNILEIGEVGAQVKHVAKTIMGSSYAIDRRKK